MENLGECDQKKLTNELLRGKELAKQLQIHLNVRPSPSNDNNGGGLLVEKILCSYEKALSLLISSNNGMIQISESPSSLNGGSPSPRSEGSDPSSDQFTNPNSFRKRNILPTWTHRFQVTPGMPLEGCLDDGFCWTKYGQKGILGAKHPRGYYRCTHRNLQGCLATKQVQRSDNDPTIFKITYRGNHSCSQVSNFTTPSTTTQEFQQQNQGVVIEAPDQEKVQNQQITSPDALLNSSWTSLRVITQNLDKTQEPTLPFHYEAADRIDTSTVDVNFPEFSPCSSFLSPTTTSGSGLSYFSASSSGFSEGFVGNDQKVNLLPNKSEIFSSPTSSALNSQTPALDIPPFGELQIDPTFTFDNSNFFS